MGHKPPVFDVLSWNADGKNLPAALHLQFLDLSRQTRSAAPAAMAILDTPGRPGNDHGPRVRHRATTDHLDTMERLFTAPPSCCPGR
jgi:polyhydroxyalkanoate synthase